MSQLIYAQGARAAEARRTADAYAKAASDLRAEAQAQIASEDKRQREAQAEEEKLLREARERTAADAKLPPDILALLDGISKKVIGKIEEVVQTTSDSNGRNPYKDYKLGDFSKGCKVKRDLMGNQTISRVSTKAKEAAAKHIEYRSSESRKANEKKAKADEKAVELQ